MQTQQRTHCPILPTATHTVSLTSLDTAINSHSSSHPSDGHDDHPDVMSDRSPDDILFGDIQTRTGQCWSALILKMICIFLVRFRKFLLNKYNRNKTRQFNSKSKASKFTILAQFPPCIFVTRCAHYSDILTSKWAMIDAGHELDVRTKLIINKMLTRADVRG